MVAPGLNHGSLLALAQPLKTPVMGHSCDWVRGLAGECLYGILIKSPNQRGNCYNNNILS